MTYIKDELCKLASSDMYPLHMPGHKRRLDCDINPYTYDITEIDGFDNLHAAEGIIKEAEERAAASSTPTPLAHRPANWRTAPTPQRRSSRRVLPAAAVPARPMAR